MSRERGPDYDATAAGLDRLELVPDDALVEVVTRDGLCMWAFDRTDVPEMTGQVSADRELAAWLCAGCPVQTECLELELRQAGPNTVGVWGALPEDDRRALHARWRARREGGPSS